VRRTPGRTPSQGRTPWSARDVLVPPPLQRYEALADAIRPTRGSAALPGVPLLGPPPGPPH
jgi:hypothetical protein